MKTGRQISIAGILFFIIFVLIYGTQYIYKLDNTNLTLLIIGGISGGFGLFNIIIRGSSSQSIDDVKTGIIDIKEGVLNVKGDIIEIKEEQLKTKTDIKAVNDKVEEVAFVVTKNDLKDAEKFEFLTRGFYQLENQLKKAK